MEKNMMTRCRLCEPDIGGHTETCSPVFPSTLHTLQKREVNLSSPEIHHVLRSNLPKSTNSHTHTHRHTYTDIDMRHRQTKDQIQPPWALKMQKRQNNCFNVQKSRKPKMSLGHPWTNSAFDVMVQIVPVLTLPNLPLFAREREREGKGEQRLNIS